MICTTLTETRNEMTQISLLVVTNVNLQLAHHQATGNLCLGIVRYLCNDVTCTVAKNRSFWSLIQGVWCNANM